jgi:hypothetical protein
VIANLGGEVAWSRLAQYPQRGHAARAVGIQPLPVVQPGAQPAGEEVENGQHQDDGSPGRKVDAVGQDQASHRGTESQYIM